MTLATALQAKRPAGSLPPSKPPHARHRPGARSARRGNVHPSSCRPGERSHSMKRSKFLQRVAMMLAIVPAGAIPYAVHADAVTDWNAIMQATVSAPPSNPVFQSRWGAIVQLAVFEAVNAVTGDYEPYLGTIAAPPWASPDAAAVAAAHRTLVTLRPDQAAALDALRAQSLAAILDGPAKAAGIAVGEEAAAAMIALRADDGSNADLP